MTGFHSTPRPRVSYRLGRPAKVIAAALTALGTAFDVEFVPDSPEARAQGEPLVIIGDSGKDLLMNRPPGRVLIVPEETAGAEKIDAIEICGDIPGAAWLRQRRLTLPRGTRVSPLQLNPGCEVMARAKSGPVWVREREGEFIIDWVSLPVAFKQAQPGKQVLEIVDGATFPLLLPWMQFLREVTGADRWRSSLKACFMFDDPNLHGSSYGYIRFAQVAAWAREHRYHVAFATVPRDAWFTSSRAAGIFRENAEFLSLLIHGNDHVWQELNQDHDDEARMAMLAQALRRIRRLEASTGLEVCRVMAPPHGLCRDRVMRGMARFGFEAASISNGSIRVGSLDVGGPKIVGSRPAEIIEGLPIIPRFQFAADSYQKILLAAYLGQPIIPTGHHQDVADGLGILQDLADQINGLGSVGWMRMSEIARSHYQWRQVGDTMVVRPYSRLLKILIPDGVARLQVEPGEGSGFAAGSWTLSSHPRGGFNGFDPAAGVAVAARTTVWLKPAAEDPVDPAMVAAPGFKLWPLARRLACEARDRMKPWTGVSPW